MFSKVLLWLYLFFLAKAVAYDNLALNKEREQSSTHFEHGKAENGNDGNTNNGASYPDNSCIHTLQSTSIQEAWWRVNLGFITRIHEIIITYRRGFANKFAGFSIFVSNSTVLKTGIRCFKQSGSLPDVERTPYPCTAIGQYVTVYNNRFHNTTYPDGYNTGGAVLELCEVEVPGCNSGRYGENCGNSCFCKGLTCDYKTGKCDGDCQPGYTGEACNNTCAPGYFGDNCLSTCPHCTGDKTCNQSGVCLNGCEAGFFPKQSPGCLGTCGKCASVTCNTEGTCPNGCIDGYYLATCNDSCPNNCNNRKCEQDSGNCLSCKDGYYDTKCNQKCPDNCLNERCDMFSGLCLACDAGYFGDTCLSECPNCGGDKTCNQSGVCINGCEAGYFPGQSPGCTQTCGHCEDVACNVNGTCPSGCIDASYYMSTCKESCPVNCNNSKCEQSHGNCFSCKDEYYDTKCDQKCPENCLNKKCIINTGHCIACDPGYYGEKCLSQCLHCGGHKACNNSGVCLDGCEVGFYYDDSKLCSEQCGHCNGTRCNLDGSCPKGCVDGYYSLHCTARCPNNCHNKRCERQFGKCIECKNGYFDEHCDVECPKHCLQRKCDINSGTCLGCEPGRYGHNCSHECLHCGGNKTCNEFGFCLNGCETGYLSDYTPGCRLKRDHYGKDMTTNFTLPLTIGIASGGVFLVLLGTILNVVCYRRKRAQTDTKSQIYMQTIDEHPTDHVYSDIQQGIQNTSRASDEVVDLNK